MQVDALSSEKAPEVVTPPEQPGWTDPAYADSFGKSLAKGFGKDKGYGGNVTQQLADKADRLCSCCGLKGHHHGSVSTGSYPAAKAA